MYNFNLMYIFLLIVLNTVFINTTAFASSFPSYGVIYNSTVVADRKIALGVNPEGHLNTPRGSGPTTNAGGSTGIAYKFSPGENWKDATSPGCLCEGFGVSALDGYGVMTSGFANVAVNGGARNLEVKSFVVDTTSIVSTVWIKDSKGQPLLEVTHRYGPSAEAPEFLFQGLVTVTNISGTPLKDIRYRRVMDWDVPPTEFSEHVTHVGVAASYASSKTPKIFTAGNNGFQSADPKEQTGYLMNGETRNVDFNRNGPRDHGSSFTFSLGELICGESANFIIYYGAAETRSIIVNALGKVKATIYSLGEARTGSNITFAFGFRGVSGAETAIAPTLPIKMATLPAGIKTSELLFQTYAPPILSGNYIYQTLFQFKNNKQWAGEIKRYTIDDSGELTSEPPVTAASKLISRASLADTNSYRSGGRSIWSVGSGCSGTALAGTLLSKDADNNNITLSNSSLVTQLLYNCNPPVSTSQATDLINFIRGKDSYLENTGGPNSARSSVLGETFHSEMLVVGPPNALIRSESTLFGKSEAYYRHSKGYKTFLTAQSSRRKQIYVGANDGMLHAFDENLNERWAFIPPSVMPRLRDMAGTKGATAGTGTSNSVFNVDGPLISKDIYIESVGIWKTILIGGLGYGGKSYYALDITNPDLPTHLFTINNDVTNKVVEYWDASGKKTSVPYASASKNIDFSKLGDTWSRPVIMLLPFSQGSQQQKWVAVFGGGFAGGTTTGYGPYVFAIDLEPNSSSSPVSTGGQILTGLTPTGPIPVTSKSGSNQIPNGVTAHLTAITNEGTSKANYYGGILYFTDLQGQMWKLDLTKLNLVDANPSSPNLLRVFDTESTLDNDRFGFNQLGSTIVGGSSSDSYIFHYFGTGDQTRIQRRSISSSGAVINNRIYGISDPDFPLPTLSNPNKSVSRGGLTNINSSSSSCVATNSWYADVCAKTTGISCGISDNQKIIGRAGVFNKQVYFSAYRPDDPPAGQCSYTGASRLIEVSDLCSGTKSLVIGPGLATAPVIDRRGNIYVGVSNIPAGSKLLSGRDNIAKLVSTNKKPGGTVQYKSWREVR